MYYETDPNEGCIDRILKFIFVALFIIAVATGCNPDEDDNLTVCYELSKEGMKGTEWIYSNPQGVDHDILFSSDYGILLNKVLWPDSGNETDYYFEDGYLYTIQITETEYDCIAYMEFDPYCHLLVYPIDSTGTMAEHPYTYYNENE